MKLGENIKAYRKKRGLTQEQLAEQMSVSVGAVSKWESGASFPELSTLTSLAVFFRISIDALIGFELESQSRENSLLQIRQMTKNKMYEEGSFRVEDILLTHPNDFNILYAGARFFHLKGVERADRPSLERALQLYNKSILFLEQNRDTRINRTVLENDSAHILLELGQYDEALAILRRNNLYDINTLRIAQTMVNNLHLYEEALPMLSQQFFGNLSDLFNVAVSFATAYLGLGRDQEAADVLQRIWPLLDSFKSTGRASIFDKAEVVYRATLAVVQHKLGDSEASVESLRLAARAARRFDRDPGFDLTGFPHFFLSQDYYVYDDFGADSIAAVDSWLEALQDGEVIEIWQKVKEEEDEA